MKYLFMMVLLAYMVRSNTTGVLIDETPLKMSGVRRKHMTPKEKKKADEQELREAIRREKLENIDNSSSIGTGIGTGTTTTGE